MCAIALVPLNALKWCQTYATPASH